MYGYYHYFYEIAMGLVSLDLWILLKARRLTKSVLIIFGSLFRAVFLMALGAGALLAFVLARDEIELQIYAEKYSHSRLEPIKDPVLGVDIASISHSSSYLEEKLEYLKNQALDLESNLKKMKIQYKDLKEVAQGRSPRDEELADFASEAAGGLVLDTPNTDSYYEPWHQQTTLFGIPIWKANYFTPRKVIQPWTQAGECWAFKGSWGKIVIELAYPTLIDQVTLEHILPTASLTGSIKSAPKDFVLYGLIDGKFVALDSFSYDINRGQSSQTFKLGENGEEASARLYPIKTILIEVQSNWGHRDYTCIYRFKVHGTLSEIQRNPFGERGIEEMYIDQKIFT